MTFPTKWLLIFLFPALLLATLAFGQEKTMYSWTDENGVVHFSDIEPQGRQAQEQSIPQGDQPAATDPYASQNGAGPSYADQRRQQIATNKQSAQQEQAVNSSRCASWRAEVGRLEPNRRVFYTNEQGETERMDDVQRTDRVAELKALIAQNCP